MPVFSSRARAISQDSQDVLKALGLSIGAAVTLGLSRIAYALPLPPMQESLRWNYAKAGTLNSANAFGYIAGAVMAAWVAQGTGLSRGFQAGIAVSALVLLATAGYLIG